MSKHRHPGPTRYPDDLLFYLCLGAVCVTAWVTFLSLGTP